MLCQLHVGVAMDHCDGEGAELEGEALNISIDLSSNLHLWSQALGLIERIRSPIERPE